MDSIHTLVEEVDRSGENLNAKSVFEDFRRTVDDYFHVVKRNKFPPGVTLDGFHTNCCMDYDVLFKKLALLQKADFFCLALPYAKKVTMKYGPISPFMDVSLNDEWISSLENHEDEDERQEEWNEEEASDVILLLQNLPVFPEEAIVAASFLGVPVSTPRSFQVYSKDAVEAILRGREEYQALRQRYSAWMGKDNDLYNDFEKSYIHLLALQRFSSP